MFLFGKVPVCPGETDISAVGGTFFKNDMKSLLAETIDPNDFVQKFVRDFDVASRIAMRTQNSGTTRRTYEYFLWFFVVCVSRKAHFSFLIYSNLTCTHL
jgi:hypothetical protein